MRASKFAIEVVCKLTRAPVERLPQLIALGFADLSHPAVLQRAKRDDQHDKGDRREQRKRKTRRGHDPESSTRFFVNPWLEVVAQKRFTFLTISFLPLNHTTHDARV